MRIYKSVGDNDSATSSGKSRRHSTRANDASALHLRIINILKAYKHLPSHNGAMSSTSLRNRLHCVPTLHGIIPGVYFNKIWGNPLDDDVPHCHHVSAITW
jgi:hypothetical protein